ncbi:hypothetical protein CANARDRAFT_29929 [[Candida] arabinofermentans NRRL YB-2248]|uniref:Uncharacterized protein n=1 Tax=[Candida] arabinofermentans NRRL YB-2248 TaxID=983967 RepID=A0A1E4SVE6_9ASCO|nr:hypothetical protein CANARDRAFT_29929 [[Candida] arabinofermentans NRRL YB-2248]
MPLIVYKNIFKRNIIVLYKKKRIVTLTGYRGVYISRCICSLARGCSSMETVDLARMTFSLKSRKVYEMLVIKY